MPEGRRENLLGFDGGADAPTPHLSRLPSTYRPLPLLRGPLAPVGGAAQRLDRATATAVFWLQVKRPPGIPLRARLCTKGLEQQTPKLPGSLPVVLSLLSAVLWRIYAGRAAGAYSVLACLLAVPRPAARMGFQPPRPVPGCCCLHPEIQPRVLCFAHRLSRWRAWVRWRTCWRCMRFCLRAKLAIAAATCPPDQLGCRMMSAAPPSVAASSWTHATYPLCPERGALLHGDACMCLDSCPCRCGRCMEHACHENVRGTSNTKLKQTGACTRSAGVLQPTRSLLLCVHVVQVP